MKPLDQPLVLASSSPRRRELLKAWGYPFVVNPPDDNVEQALLNQQGSAIELVRLLAFEKAKDVASRVEKGLILAADTVAECHGEILGKPVDRAHAGAMLRKMSGQRHFVHSGLCLWSRPAGRHMIRTDTTTLVMDPLSEDQIADYLDTGLWQGKAGAFGYQDDLDWIHIENGSPSNVVGLPRELFEKMLTEFA